MTLSLLVSPLDRFFLMYLINKDETEHTGQVRWRSKPVLSNKTKMTIKVMLPLCFFRFSTGVLCMEDVSGEMLGLLPCWRLFPQTIRGPVGLEGP